MDIAGALEFVRSNHQAVLITTKNDGTPQSSPVTVGVDDDGHLIISTRESLAKTKNLLKRPTAVLCCFTDQFYGEWIQVTGETEVVTGPEAVEVLVEYYRRISGEHPDWDEYREAMVRDGRVALRITPTDVVPR